MLLQSLFPYLSLVGLAVAMPKPDDDGSTWGGDGYGDKPSKTYSSKDCEPTKSSKIHTVIVGGDAGLVYTPNYVDAKVGDKVIFQFEPKNHTATQSSFDEPCTRLKDKKGNVIGVSSGFEPVSNTTTVFPTFTFDVQVETPIWFYCGQVGHCPAGMVFGINPPKTGNTIDAFIAKAKALAPPPPSTSTPPKKSDGGDYSGKDDDDDYSSKDDGDDYSDKDDGDDYSDGGDYSGKKDDGGHYSGKKDGEDDY